VASRKIKIITNCVANHYASPNERIVEFNSPYGGGLISFWMHEDGTLSVDLYELDEKVKVIVQEGHNYPRPEERNELQTT
jgi:hypothetical protein